MNITEIFEHDQKTPKNINMVNEHDRKKNIYVGQSLMLGTRNLPLFLGKKFGTQKTRPGT